MLSITQEKLTATPLEQDAELSQVAALQQAFKSPTMRAVAVAVVRAAMSNGGSVWPDDPALTGLVAKLAGDDKNCVGTAWRWLGKIKVMEKTSERRNSKAKSTKGREVGRWKILNWRLAETFVKRNAAASTSPQMEMFR